MSRTPISPIVKRRYEAFRAEGWTITDSALKSGVSRYWASNYEKSRGTGKLHALNQDQEAALKRVGEWGAPRSLGSLGGEPKAALEDFGLFRRRYFGRIASPWQEEAANRMVDLLASPQKEFVVVNCPPGSGKSTLFTHDIPAWMIVRNRAVRMIIGSRTERQAKTYTKRLRDSLERPLPVKADSELLAKGRAFDADSTLASDYGSFRPENPDIWRADQFVVAQYDLNTTDEKEPTAAAFGMDSGSLGWRVDYIVWDDVVDNTTVRTVEMMEKQRVWWEDEAETRLEPDGLLVLQGQRIHANDLYRFCLDMKTGDSDEGVEAPKYKHIVYRAHYEDRCREVHKPKDAVAYPDGCLLDPVRLPWRELRAIEYNRQSKYRVLYQQEDLDPASVLVPMLWVTGGKDANGEDCPGCWDNNRDLWEIPKGLTRPWTVIASADPSPTKFWSIQCVAAGTPVTTSRGDIPIQQVCLADKVLTRGGWRPVQHVTQTGVRPVVALGLSNGQTLRATPDHLVLTADGWVEAGELTPGSELLAVDRRARAAVSFSASQVEVRATQGVAAPTVSLGSLPSSQSVPTQRVFSRGHDFEMVGVHAGSIAAEMVEFPVAWDVPNEKPVRQSVCQTFPIRAERLGDTAVPLAVSGLGPGPAVGVAGGGPGGEVGLIDRDLLGFGSDPIGAGFTDPGSFAGDRLSTRTVHVVSITDGSTVPVYDIGVCGEHEFTAAGVIVHNCWLVHHDTQQRFLLDLIRQSMDAPDFLDWNSNNGVFSGIMEEWQNKSVSVGAPIQYWVVEQNAAQRFLLQYDHVRRWIAKHGVSIIGHETQRNKSDAQYGVQTIAPHYRYGRVRLPGVQHTGARIASLKLVDEVTRWPDGQYDDCVMAQWMAEWNIPRLARRAPVVRRSWRPSWVAA